MCNLQKVFLHMCHDFIRIVIACILGNLQTHNTSTFLLEREKKYFKLLYIFYATLKKSGFWFKLLTTILKFFFFLEQLNCFIFNPLKFIKTKLITLIDLCWDKIKELGRTQHFLLWRFIKLVVLSMIYIEMCSAFTIEKKKIQNLFAYLELFTLDNFDVNMSCLFFQIVYSNSCAWQFTFE